MIRPGASAFAPGGKPPHDQLAYFGELARRAWEAGQAAAAAGDTALARRWLMRARRLAPKDNLVAFSLAMVLLAEKDPAAEPLFAGLAREFDRREAWLGLAAIRLGRDAGAAAGAAAQALSRHAPDPALALLLDRVAEASGAAGWCGLEGGGVLVLGALSPRAALEIRADGRKLPIRRPIAAAGAISARFPLPPSWRTAAQIEVRESGRPLLGSPLLPSEITRIEGFVAASPEGGIEGWAWHPGDPGRDPSLTVRGGGGAIAFTAATLLEPRGNVWLSRPRGFRLEAPALARLRAPLAVIGADGRRLLGSPLDPGAERRGAAAVAAAVAALFPADETRRPPGMPRQAAHAAVPAALRGPPAAPRRRSRPCDVVIPVYRGLADTRACLASVLATIPAGTRVIVVDDASPESALARLLDGMAAEGRIQLIRLPRNHGFPAAANAGLRAAARRDAILLNSDTLVPPGWFERLRAAAYAAADIGTVTPLSNDATILSYPGGHGGDQARLVEPAVQLDRLAARANKAELVEIPTAIGFCMYLRRDCLDAVGLLREDVFAQGYGEENDFCLRARHLGWRHMAATGLFVAHRGGASFGAARAQLLERNLAVLERLHPGYGALITAHLAADPLAPARRRMDMLRWARGRRPAGAAILVTHADGGGVRRRVREHCAHLAATGLRPIVLRPDLPPGGGTGSCAVSEGVVEGPSEDRFPNLRFRLPEELPALLRLLGRDRPRHVEIHHLLGHDHAVMQLPRALGVPYDVYLHDYLWFCPRIALVGADRRYCGEPDIRSCEACVADAGSNLEEEITVPALVARSGADLRRARRVIAPSADAATRIRRHFHALRPDILPWEEERGIAPPPMPHLGPRAIAGRRRILVPGGIGPEKGYDVLIACARDAYARDLPLEFVLVGFSSDDDRLLATERVFVTGQYTEAEAEALMRAEAATLAFLPSIWPETWSYTLTQAWRAGLRVLAFDIGAPAERIRRTGWGWLLPLGLPAASINNALAGRAPLRPDNG